jgi:ADP-heptose:LPS heptosyltransferase
VESVAEHLHCDAIIAAGKTSLGAAGVLIQHAYALLSNCTGVSHIAAALRTPSVVISMDGEPERWAPSDHQLHRTIDWTRTPDFSVVLDQLKSLLNDCTLTESPGLGMLESGGK